MITILWTILLIFCIVAEILTSISLVTIWFIPGIIVALILSAIHAPVWLQLLAFVLLSIVSLILTKNIVKKRKAKLVKTNAEALIGRQTELLSDYTCFQNASVKFGDVVWSAKAEDNSELPKGTLVKIIKIEGNTLVVQKGD